MGWMLGLAAVAALVVLGLAMAARGQATVRDLAAARGWRYEKTGPETFRLRGREPSGDWVATYGRGSGADAGRLLSFEFALPTTGEATLVARFLRNLVTQGLTGAVARGLNALPGAKAGLVLEGTERAADWVRDPRFAQTYALVGDPEALRPALGDRAAARLAAYAAPLLPTVSAKHGRCRATLSVRTTAQAIDALPEFVETGRAMMGP